MRRPLLAIFLIVTADVVGLTIMIPLLPFYAEKLGASPTVVGLLLSCYALCQLVAGPLLGQISDRVGRRPILLVSQLGTFVSRLMLAWASGLALVFASRAIDGLTAGNLSIAQAYIADVTPPKDRAKSFAVIGIAFGIGFLIGPALSGLLARWGLLWPILLSAGFSLASIVGTWFLLEEPSEHVPEPAPVESTAAPPPAADVPAAEAESIADKGVRVLDVRTYARFFKRRGLGALLWQFFLFTFSFAMYTAGFALFAERRFTWHGHAFGTTEVGYVFTFVGFVSSVVQGLMGKLVKAFGERALTLAGMAMMALGYGLMGFAYGIPVLLAAAAIGSVGGGILRPTLTSLITQQVGRSEQGTVLGLNQSLMSVSQIVGPFLAGLLIDRALLVPWALATGGVMALGLLFAPRAEAATSAA